ncbi:cysteine-tRNA synthetase [Pseudoloma neurophilia]|uniref:cysteine--tRNA ligase n=1 Tax=Pseudoloma neurophilia TaxID=146866 RepID=A0A0R0M772_9MICR|nr:cysteine-tRNA synthetase [Pseudoloma neurophilia]
MEPTDNKLTDTAIYDTLTNKICPLPRHINIYICGPTVYDAAHLGHGRTYILFDTIIRTLKYLGHSVTYTMNITDVDDKILVKTKNFLIEFIKSNFNYLKPFNELFHNNEKYLEQYIERIDTFQRPTILDQDALRTEYVNDIKILENELAQTGKNQEQQSLELTEQLIMARLSFLFSAFYDCQKYLTENFTNLFFEDLKCLNVKKPNFITKVTDYIPKIISFIEKLVANDSAYVVNGSVYFDMEKYLIEGNSRPFHKEGETTDEITDLGKNKKFDEKKNLKDFALWKRSYHPLAYESPFGKGRPGWHIECSAMSNDIFFGRDISSDEPVTNVNQDSRKNNMTNKHHFDRNSLHLHGGGIDLAFPHHENEILQSISLDYTERRDKNIFSNYFSHTGHLHIEGLKMSKSLKNFITISDCLQNTNFKVLRLMFLLVPYKNTAIYKPDTVEYAERLLSKINNFISSAEAEIKRRVLLQKRHFICSEPSQKKPDTIQSSPNQEYSNSEKDFEEQKYENFMESSSSPNPINNTVEDPLFKKNETMNKSFELADRLVLDLLNSTKLEVIAHLQNNFEFAKTIHCLLNFIAVCNQKMYEINGQLLENVVEWINEILEVFGLKKDVDENYDTILETKNKDATGDAEKMANLIKEFREQIRNNLKQKDTKGLYTTCDNVRDKLREFGWILEDKGNESILRRCRD